MRGPKAGTEARKFILALVLTTATLSLGATNCRFFGNYQESGAPADPYSGFYEMAPQSASLWLVHANRGTLQSDVSFNRIPEDGVNLSFSNPVAFLADNLDAGVGRIISLWDNRFYQYFRWTPETGALALTGSASPTAAWDLSQCTYQTWYILAGNLRPGDGPFTTGTNRPLTGRIEMTVEATTRFEGADCVTFLDTLQNCYLDSMRCGPNSSTSEERKRRQGIATGLFGHYIDAGIIQATDISRSTALSYRIEYR